MRMDQSAEEMARQAVSDQIAPFVAGLESVGLRRDLILDGMERGLQALRGMGSPGKVN